MLPSVTDPGEDEIRSVEAQLSSHPAFGNSEFIVRRADARYRFALEILSSRLPGIAAEANAITRNAEHVLRDPILMTACEDALLRLARDSLQSPDEFETVIGLIAGRLRRSPSLLPTQAEETPLFRIGTSRAWMLGMSADPGPLLRRLHTAMADQFLTYNKVSGNFCPADEGAVRSISRAIELLRLLLPRLSAGIMDHIAAIGLLTGITPTGRHLSAAGGDLVPRTLVLSPDALSSPWNASGILLHEGLHLKAFDIMRSFALVSEPRQTIEIPWRRVRWDMRRVFASFHVYSHLVLFQAAAAHSRHKLAARFGPLPGNVGVSHGQAGAYASPVQRMRFLGNQLTGPMRGTLTPDGIRFVAWLLRVMSPFTGLNEPAGSSPSGIHIERPGARAPLDSRGTRYNRTPGIIVKAFPDLEIAYAYNPATRQVSCLNLHAWAILELCDGSAKFIDSYTGLVGPRVGAENAARQAAAGLAQLAAQGLIEPVRGGD